MGTPPDQPKAIVTHKRQTVATLRGREGRFPAPSATAMCLRRPPNPTTFDRYPQATPTAMHHPPHHVIRLRLDSIHQLFNSLDPSPFVGRDLDGDAEAFIMAWAMEYPPKGEFCLEITLPSPLSSG